MNRKYLPYVLTGALSVLAPLWGAGNAGAYLSPSNPAVLTADPAQIQYMDPSYLNDYVTPAAPGYVIGPGKIPDYLTSSELGLHPASAEIC